MKMFKGTLFITTDVNILQQLVYNNKVIIIGEPDPAMINALNAVVGSILLPPYLAMMAQMDGNINEFYNQYYLHLYTKEPQEFIATILKALTLGKNIVMYCTEDEFKLCGQFLLQFLQKDFGIVVGTQNNQFYFDPAYTPTVTTLLYINDLVTADELFMLYPDTIPINDIILPKLVQELHPVVDEQTKDSYLKYFGDLNHRVKLNHKFRKSPISMGM